MRRKLKEIGEKERHNFIGEVVRFGWKNGWMGSERLFCLRTFVSAMALYATTSGSRLGSSLSGLPFSPETR